MSPSQVMKKAFALGQKAAKKGHRRVPLMDKALINMLANQEGGPFYKEWLRGYDQQRLGEARKLQYGEKVVPFKDLANGDKFQIVDRGHVLDGVSTKVGPRSHKNEAGEKWGISQVEKILPVKNPLDEGPPAMKGSAEWAVRKLRKETGLKDMSYITRKGVIKDRILVTVQAENARHAKMVVAALKKLGPVDGLKFEVVDLKAAKTVFLSEATYKVGIRTYGTKNNPGSLRSSFKVIKKGLTADEALKFYRQLEKKLGVEPQDKPIELANGELIPNSIRAMQEPELVKESVGGIKQEYKQLAKLSCSQLEAKYSRIHPGSSPKGEPKDVLISGILRAHHGGSRCAAAAGLAESAIPEPQQQGIQAILKKYTGKEVPDDVVHKFAEDNGLSPHDVESYIYSLASAHVNENDKLKGWDPELLQLAKQYDRNEVRMGLNVEKAHDIAGKLDVVKDKNDLLKIALAHLAEDPEYYTKLKQVEGESYAPSEYPQMRDPYRQGGFTNKTHVSTNGIPNDAALRTQKKVKFKPIDPDDEDERPRLKEEDGSTETMRIMIEGFIKGRYATGAIKLQRDSAPVGHGFSIDINGTSMTDLDHPHDSARIEMAGFDDGTEYGSRIEGVEYKDVYEFVLKRIKSAGLTRFFNKVRNAGGVQPIAHVPGTRFRALVRPSLKGSIRFVEYDFNRYEFKL